MDLKKYCLQYLNQPIDNNKFILIHKLKEYGHPSAFMLQTLMIFSMLHNDIFLENWFIQCVKKLLENPNIIFSCPEDYEDMFNDDENGSVS